MNKYIRKNKHFRYLYGKSEAYYFYNKFYLEFVKMNSVKYSNNNILLEKKNKINKVGKYNSRIFNCCILTGRSNSVYKKYHINRTQLRQFISKGYMPGVRKSSW